MQNIIIQAEMTRQLLSNLEKVEDHASNTSINILNSVIHSPKVKTFNINNTR